MLAASAIIPLIVRNGMQRLMTLSAEGSSVMAHPTPAGALALLESGLGTMLELALPIVGTLAAVAIFANVAQVGFLFASEAAKPTLSRVSPKAGLKRLFSANSLWELLKQLAKLVLLVFITYRSVRGIEQHVVPSEPVDMGPMLSYAASQILAMVRDISLVGLVVGLADYAYQRRRVNQTLKMTKQEIKEEARHTDGDPLVRQAIRRKQASLSRIRMMAAVAGADVVVTNPTHYAVALRYEPGVGRAPRVVAKGAGEVALRIRAQAQEHGVPVVEDPPLARAIYGACEIGTQIPEQLYMAVARLLAFVFTLPAMVRNSGIVQRRATTALVA